MNADPSKALLQLLLADPKVKEKAIASRAMEIVASEEGVSLHDLSASLKAASEAAIPSAEQRRLMRIVHDKYKELERVGYPLIALDDPPHPYYCLYGAALGDGPTNAPVRPGTPSRDDQQTQSPPPDA